MKEIFVALVIFSVIGLGLWWEIASWNECLTDHSWWYCLRTMN